MYRCYDIKVIGIYLLMLKCIQKRVFLVPIEKFDGSFFS